MSLTSMMSLMSLMTKVVQRSPLPASASDVPPGRVRPLTRDPAEALARVVIAGVFLAFAIRIGANFLETGRITGLLLLANEMLVVVLTLARRAAVCVDRTWLVRAVAAVSLVGPPLLRPTAEAGVAPEIYSVMLSACGLVIVVTGKLSLGRSFGLLPANRGVVCSGIYRVVRHPIYLGYLMTHLGFLAANATLGNALVLLAVDSALIVRTVYEERVLARDPAYASYRRRVKWRILPGVV